MSKLVIYFITIRGYPPSSAQRGPGSLSKCHSSFSKSGMSLILGLSNEVVLYPKSVGAQKGHTEDGRGWGEIKELKLNAMLYIPELKTYIN